MTTVIAESWQSATIEPKHLLFNKFLVHRRLVRLLRLMLSTGSDFLLPTSLGGALRSNRMKTLYGLAVFGLVLLFSTTDAKAQYPSYGGYGQIYGGHHWHGNHHVSLPQSYVQGYGNGISAYGFNNSIPQQYSSNYAYPQAGVPQVSSFYSNNYYVRPTYSHHSWHQGHYLFGHH